jgi:hypothetical protein
MFPIYSGVVSRLICLPNLAYLRGQRGQERRKEVPETRADRD